MKKIFLTILLTAGSLFAEINVDATYATMGAIAKRIGGDNVHVVVLGSSKYDPHFIVPKPSLLAKLRRADLLIINGGGLELGWLPPLIKSANNGKIQVGAQGFLDMSHFIKMIDKPASVSRAFGDIHAQGNPHYSTDPHQVSIMAKAIAKKLSQIDPAHANEYQQNLEQFLAKWNAYLTNYDNKMAACKVKKIVQYHELYNYFLRRYDITNIGNIEPLPGIAPSSKHTLELINAMKANGVKKILQDVYHEKRTAKFIAAKTGATVSVIPHEVGAVKGSDTLENFYNTIAQRICK
ncbi:metal ABC transporter substrate-binding protein [Sulfurimonas paralvinellae]|uniref:Metal ABC transporter substrate-binding protein n=1 Tax=Sulfurimonas paralvinellae TaxID=317658 RepID=A0A7M1B8J5_9BACT|nr:zinc ABC transporter substrate-binding protein [Sulfurimonas paralvinellae]QOP45931.1 metal ABC transporter substrate-binding protein [Sulfurimonas paralvinellae]